MPRRKEHSRIGGTWGAWAGGASLVISELSARPNHRWTLGEVLALAAVGATVGAIGGSLGGVAPDVLNPSSDGLWHHRRSAHSVAAGVAVASAGIAAQSARELPSIARAFAAGGAAGYVSHLEADSYTRLGIPAW